MKSLRRPLRKQPRPSPWDLTKAGLPSGAARHPSMHRYVPVRLTVCADAAVAANTAAAAMTHDVILMKTTPLGYADPTIWGSRGILGYSDLQRLVPSALRRP